jgi:hypothetical protein
VPRAGATGYDALQFQASTVCVAHKARHADEARARSTRDGPASAFGSMKQSVDRRGRNACRAMACTRVGTGMVAGGGRGGGVCARVGLAMVR